MRTDIDDRLDRIESERELSRLVYNYCHGLDRKDVELVLSIWHDDATYAAISAIGSYTGTSEIKRAFTEKIWPAFKHQHHWTINLVIDIDGDKAKALSNFTFQGETADGTAMMAAGTYHDEFARRRGRWGFTYRRVEAHHIALLPGISFATPT
jgi:ketosteroid isomerase-like protein